MNGSFLLSKDQHYCCTSKHHGLDLAVAQSCFTAISRANNSSVRDVVSMIIYIIENNFIAKLLFLFSILDKIPQLVPQPLFPVIEDKRKPENLQVGRLKDYRLRYPF